MPRISPVRVPGNEAQSLHRGWVLPGEDLASNLSSEGENRQCLLGNMYMRVKQQKTARRVEARHDQWRGVNECSEVVSLWKEAS